MNNNRVESALENNSNTNISSVLPENIIAKTPDKIIFFADDEELIRLSVARSISNINKKFGEKHIVKAFNSAEDLLMNIDADNKCDIVITDQNMGDMNGLELIKKLRERNYPVKIYMASNYNKTEMEDIAKKAGGDGFFQAPIGENEIRLILQM
ncbi:MAG: response regulator [Oligoflexia bacterium]|nr:response regulator [Oligoflexia bacterium]